MAEQPWVDSGILRSGKSGDDEELLVFGYSCKLFRDDEKALLIDQGKHLIPWMGDESLKIDRYDGRAALPDLRPFEATADLDLLGMTEAERQIEAKCDEERYWALTHKEDQVELFREEELKRLQQELSRKEYGAVQYSYDDKKQPAKESKEQEEEEEEEDDTPFVAPAELDIPVNMVLPTKQKLHAIVEKTALFISQQGGQMEVLLKAKQSGNQQFGFLSYDHELHAYYKLVLTAIRNNRYKLMRPEEKDESEEDASGDEHYLHPSLAGTTIVDAAPSIPSISYRPSANCAYSMLVSKIKGKPIELGRRSPEVKAATNGAEPAPKEPPEKEAPPIPAVAVPDPELQTVVDKIACYVAKNGPDFESVVRSKGDSRFMFLDPNHAHYAYYCQRTQFFIEELKPKQNSKGKTPMVPVSFSIKAQSGEGVLEKRSALETELRPRAAAAYMATALQSVSDVPLPPCPPPEAPEVNKEEEERRQAAKRLAEERLRAKLMAVAREKMASANKEKQVQQERKKKVAAFLSKLALEKRQIAVARPPPAAAPLMIGPQLPAEMQPPAAPDDDVRSIPSPSPADLNSLSPPPPPSLGSSSLAPPPPFIGGSGEGERERAAGCSFNGHSKPYQRSRSPARHSRHKHGSSSSRHQHRHKRPASRSRRHRKSPSSRYKYKKRSRNSSRDSREPKRHKKRRTRSPSSSSASSASSTSSKSRSRSREKS